MPELGVQPASVADVAVGFIMAPAKTPLSLLRKQMNKELKVLFLYVINILGGARDVTPAHRAQFFYDVIRSTDHTHTLHV